MAKTKIKSAKELKDLYRVCKGLSSPTPQQSRQRGYELESIIEFLLADLELRAAYKITGEQIDGSFFWYGQTFLLEAKWHANPLPAGDIYTFKGKVDGKFHTSSGVFISYSGYSDEAVDALRFGKVVNVLLFDKSDLDSIIEYEVPFIDVLKFKLRSAGDSGLPYVPYQSEKIARNAVEENELVMVPSRYGAKVDIDLGDLSSPLFLVISNLPFSESDLVEVFQGINLHQPVSFNFKRITTGQLMVSEISKISVLLAADGSNHFKGAILLVADDQFDHQKEEYLLEVLHKNAITIDISIIRIAKNTDQKENKPVLSMKNMQGVSNFINELLEVDSAFYNSIGARNALRNELNAAEWDYEEKTITFNDDYTGMPITIANFQDLLQHLSDLAYNVAAEETPWEILKDENFDQDFDELAYGVLSEYKSRLSRLGWGDEI